MMNLEFHELVLEEISSIVKQSKMQGLISDQPGLILAKNDFGLVIYTPKNSEEVELGLS